MNPFRRQPETSGAGTGLSGAGPRFFHAFHRERQRCSLPAPSATAPPAYCMYWMNRPIGLHPSNIIGLTGVMHDLIDDGNSIVLVDHDTQVLLKPTGSSRWGRAQARKAGRYCRRYRLRSFRKSGFPIGPFLSAWSSGHAAKHADTENVAKRKSWDRSVP